MAKKLVSFHGIHINKGTTVGGWPFGKERVHEDTADANTQRFVESFPVDAHGHLMRSVEEIGGRCAVCQELLCRDCLMHCSLDGQVLCRDHTLLIGGHPVCSTHGSLQRLVFWLSLSER